MAYGFKNLKELWQFAREMREGYRGFRGELERSIATGASYYHGKQYVTTQSRMNRNNALARLETDNNPDSNKLRVTTNRTAKLIQKSAVATHPERIEAEVSPPDREPGSEPVLRAQVYEDALAAAIDACAYESARADANFYRAICGSYVVGLSLRMGVRTVKVGGGELALPDSVLRAFSSDPTRLTVDPADTSRHLHDRDWVMYSDIWSYRKLCEFFGLTEKQLGKEEDLPTVGDLAPFQLSLNRLTDNLLFSHYRQHSKTHGAIVHQLHCKDDSGRFSEMYLMVEKSAKGDGEALWVNEDDPTTPYGGDGMPLVLLHGHRRMDAGVAGMSDAAMLKDDQDRVNLTDTFKFRQMQKNAGWHWKFDRNSIGRESSEQRVREQISNAVGSVVFWDSGTRERPGSAPELIRYPEVSSALAEQTAMYENAMRDQVHRAESNFGITKSHVTADAAQQALDQSDQVPAARVSEDIRADARLLRVLLGTTILQVQQKSPTVLGMLRRANFGGDDLAVLFDADPVHPAGNINVREGSVRFRSFNMRRQDLNNAMQLKAITGSQFRLAMARDLDSAVTQDDKYYASRADKAAAMVLRGMEWEALPLGEYTFWFLNAFRRAMLDPMADPPARQRLSRAVQSQQIMMAQEQATLTPPDAQGQPGAQGGDAEVQPDPAQASMDQMIQSLEQQTGAPAMAGAAA